MNDPNDPSPEPIDDDLDHDPLADPEPTPEPPASADRMLRLDPRVVAYWLITGTISALVLSAIAAGVTSWFWDNLPGNPTVVAVLVGSVAGSLILWALISPSLAYARWRYSITSDLLLARYGIIFHEEKAIPISRLQHVDLTRGPVERLFGLATLVVFTAGTEAASFRLPGLSAAHARDLRDQILAARGDDVI